MLAAAGVKFPPSDLARTADEAVAIAREIGFPVAMKTRASILARKTKGSHILLNIANEAAVRKAFQRLSGNVNPYNSTFEPIGVVVETMSKCGIDMMSGAKRDPKRGPVIMAGVGGVMREGVGDVLLLPANLSVEAIAEELGSLKMDKLLQGIPSEQSFDVQDLSEIAAAIGQIMLARPEIVKIDINPLVTHAAGQGATALEAVIVTNDETQPRFPTAGECSATGRGAGTVNIFQSDAAAGC